jgi:hypothetical protein
MMMEHNSEACDNTEVSKKGSNFKRERIVVMAGEVKRMDTVLLSLWQFDSFHHFNSKSLY